MKVKDLTLEDISNHCAQIMRLSQVKDITCDSYCDFYTHGGCIFDLIKYDPHGSNWDKSFLNKKVVKCDDGLIRFPWKYIFTSVFPSEEIMNKVLNILRKENNNNETTERLDT